MPNKPRLPSRARRGSCCCFALSRCSLTRLSSFSATCPRERIITEQRQGRNRQRKLRNREAGSLTPWLTSSSFCFLSCRARCFATRGFSRAKATISDRSRSPERRVSISRGNWHRGCPEFVSVRLCGGSAMRERRETHLVEELDQEFDLMKRAKQGQSQRISSIRVENAR